MTQKQYQAQQLSKLLEAIQNKQISGVLYLDAEINHGRSLRSRVLVWKEGRIMYAGAKVPDAQSLVKMLEQKLSREWASSAVAFAMRQATVQTSIRALLERLVEMQLFSWEQIETVVYNQLLLTLEQVLPHPGSFRFDSKTLFNFCRGFELSKLMQDIAQRQEQWFNFRPAIPSMEAVPNITDNSLKTITEPTVRDHLKQWVNGQRSLVDIAEGLNKDPLAVAKSYTYWVQAGWVVMENITSTNSLPSSSPTILAVDDSAVMQELIKRALANYCQVLVASNAVDALNLLYHQKISLLLLDVSMPEIDGLELCRTIRSITQFRELPIVMVTARDSFFDKVKGKFAGSNDYLTKPFDAERLRQTVGKYVSFGVNSERENQPIEFDLTISN
jgi:twitching motility two-component system response regulator PilG